jgi:hypothetical protein
MRSRLGGPFPPDLEAFFFVNTDVGAPEAARALAAALVAEPSSPARSAAVLRSLVPRTFVDCNRVLETPDADLHREKLTAAVPAYVRDPRDLETLAAMHRAYTDAAERAYGAVCGAGGFAVQLHSYAPRSVDIVRIDDDVVRALRDAYRPEVYERWPVRPEIELISEDTEGRSLTSRRVADAVLAACRSSGFDARENVTYRLHAGTWGHRHAVRHPDRTLCLELNRALLADPFTPFAEMRISPAKVERIVAPLALALAATAWVNPSRTSRGGVAGGPPSGTCG